MDFTRSRLFPYRGVRWSALVRKTLFWLVLQLHMRCFLSLLHVDASVNAASLNATGLPVNQVRTDFSNIYPKSEANSLPMQETYTPFPPVPVRKGPSGRDTASLKFGEQTAVESGKQILKGNNISDTGTAARVNGRDSALQVRFAASQVPPSRSTLSQNNREEHEHSTTRRPISRETLEGWARAGTASTYTEKSEADGDRDRFGGPYSGYIRSVDSSPVSALQSPNKPPTTAGPPLEKQPKYTSVDAIPALLSLQRVLRGQEEPVTTTTTGTTSALRGTSRPEGHEPSTFTSPGGRDTAKRDAVISPYDTASAAVTWLPGAPTGLPAVKLFDTQLPAVFEHPDRTHTPSAGPLDRNLLHQRPQQLTLSHFLDNAPQPQQPIMGETYSLQGRTLVTSGQPAEMGQRSHIGDPTMRPWYQRTVGQFFIPSSNKQQNAVLREAALPEGSLVFTQAQGSAPPEGAQTYSVYHTPAAGEARRQNSAGFPAPNTTIQGELQRLGYTEGRGLPPTKGLKTMVSGLALGLSGLAPVSAAALLGIGALRYMESKRAQGKAQMVYGGPPMP